jgi:hypothetical protein
MLKRIGLAHYGWLNEFVGKMFISSTGESRLLPSGLRIVQ